MLAGSRASMGFGRSGLLIPIWRTFQCQSPSETEFLLNFRGHREAGEASLGRVWHAELHMSTFYWIF
jgi:hypothetical protein